MEHRKKITTIFISTLLLTVLGFSISVHSRELAGSPSPSPVSTSLVHCYISLVEMLFEWLLWFYTVQENLGLIAGIRRPGSLPASCDSKCKQCKPCMPVEVSVRAAELEENEYYPQVWQCICHENIYPP